MRAMGAYAAMMVAAIALQIAFIAVFATPFGGPANFGMPAIALSETVFYAVLDLACFVYLRRRIGALGLKSTALSGARSLGLGLLGAAAGAGVVFILDVTVAPLDGSIPHALACIVCGGIAAVAVTFGIAAKAGFEEAEMLTSIVAKIARKIGRKKRSFGRCRRRRPNRLRTHRRMERAESCGRHALARDGRCVAGRNRYAPHACARPPRERHRDAACAGAMRSRHEGKTQRASRIRTQAGGRAACRPLRRTFGARSRRLRRRIRRSPRQPRHERRACAAFFADGRRKRRARHAEYAGGKRIARMACPPRKAAPPQPPPLIFGSAYRPFLCRSMAA